MAFHPGLVGITRTVSTWPSLWTVVRTLGTQAGFPCSVVCKDSAVSCPDDAVDQLRRLLTAQKVLPHDRDGKLGNQKLREADLVVPVFPKDHARPSSRPGFNAARLLEDAAKWQSAAAPPCPGR